MPDPIDAPEGQDEAEAFDEENITEDGRDIATSDMQRDVLDVTTVAEDADLDDVLAPAETDFDPDAMDEAEYEEVVLADENLDEPRTFRVDSAGVVTTDDVSPADYEPDDRAEADAAADTASAADEEVDRRLHETFPASDPSPPHPGSD